MTNQVTHHLTNQLTSHVTNHQLNNDEPGDSPVPPPDLSAQLEIATLRERAKSAEERAQTLEGAGRLPQTTPDRLGVEIPGDPAAAETEPTERGSTDPGPAATNGRRTRTGHRPLNNSGGPGPNTTPAPALVAVRKAVTRRPAEMVQAGHIQTTNSLHNAGPLGRCEPALRNGIQAMTKFDSNDML